MGLLGGRNISLVFCICIAFVLIGNGLHVDAEKEIPTTKFGQNVGGPTMTFFYWYVLLLLPLIYYAYILQGWVGVRGKVQAVNQSINFLFASCSYSCGYRKAFEDYVNILSEKYPQITVTGGNYDPPGMNMYFSKLIFAVKILLIVVIVSSFDIFGAIGQPTPSWWRHLLENKLYACMMIFFVGNMLEGQVSRLCVCVCKWNI